MLSAFKIQHVKTQPHQHFKITLIGAGNVATQLGLALINSHTIVQIFSKHKSSAFTLATILKCDYTSSIKEINSESDIYIIAVNDDAIADVVKKLKLSNHLVVHTSGSVEMDLLKNVSKNYGVFYPLQTFSKNKKTNFKNIPLCLESSNTKTFKVLKTLASSISNNVQKINSDQRKTIHLAAVFACNFSNHLYNIASDILKSKKLSLDILQPLIEETANKVRNNSPAQMQTGPAIRGDQKTMKRHLQLLSENKPLQQVYKLMSKSIIDSGDKNK